MQLTPKQKKIALVTTAVVVAAGIYFYATSASAEERDAAAEAEAQAASILQQAAAAAQAGDFATALGACSVLKSQFPDTTPVKDGTVDALARLCKAAGGASEKKKMIELHGAAKVVEAQKKLALFAAGKAPAPTSTLADRPASFRPWQELAAERAAAKPVYEKDAVDLAIDQQRADGLRSSTPTDYAAIAARLAARRAAP